MKDAGALTGPLGPGAEVLTLEARLFRAKGSEHGMGDVVSAVFATRVPTRENEQSGGVLDDDAPHVDGLGDEAPSASFLDLETQLLDRRHLGREPRGVVLAPLALGVP
jgi:hypothetical protein